MPPSYVSQQLKIVGGGEAPGPGWTTVAEARAVAAGYGLVVATAAADDSAEARLLGPTGVVSSSFRWSNRTNDLQVGPDDANGLYFQAGDLVRLQMRPSAGQRRCWLIDAQLTLSAQRIEATTIAAPPIVITTQPSSATGAFAASIDLTFAADQTVSWVLEREAANGTTVALANGIGTTATRAVAVLGVATRYRYVLTTASRSAVTSWATLTPTTSATALTFTSTPADATVLQGQSTGTSWSWSGGTGLYSWTMTWGDGRIERSSQSSNGVSFVTPFSASSSVATLSVTDGISTITDTMTVTVTAATSGVPTWQSEPSSTVSHTAGAAGTLTWQAAAGAWSVAQLWRNGEPVQRVLGITDSTPTLTADLSTLGVGTHVFRAGLVNTSDLGVLDVVTVTVTAGATLKTMTATTSLYANPVSIPAGAVAGDLVLAIATNRAPPLTPTAMTAPGLIDRTTLVTYAGADYSPGMTVWLGKLPTPLPANMTFGAGWQQALVLVEGRSSFAATAGRKGYGTAAAFDATSAPGSDPHALALVATLSPDLGVTTASSGFTEIVNEGSGGWCVLSVATDTTGLTSPITPGNATLAGNNNWTTLSIACEPTAGDVTPPPVDDADYAKPAAPNLSTAGATLVSTWSQLAAAVAAGANGARFLLSATTFNATSTIQVKQGMAFIGQSGTIIDGGTTLARAFRGGSGRHGVLFAKMKFQRFGGGTAVERIGVIDPKADEWSQGSASVSHDWRIHDCEFVDNTNCAVILGHRFIVDECDMRGHSPCAITSGFATGGLIWGNYFADNGYAGGTGVGENTATIKLIWHNVGPWGQTDRDTSRFRGYGNPVGPLFGAGSNNFEAPAVCRIVHNTFHGPRNTVKYGAGNGARGVWFDLDCRNTEVAYNDFVAPHFFGVFVEGSNGHWIHHNTFTDHTNGVFTGSFSTAGTQASKYYSAGCVVMGSSNNVTVEDNTFDDCQGCVINFHSTRGRTGADWVTPVPNGWPLATATYNFMIRNSYAPIGLGEASSVGSSNIIIRRNELSGTSMGLGHGYNNEVNRATEANHSTMTIEDNVYSGSAFRNFWNGVRYNSLAAWQAATGFDS